LILVHGLIRSRRLSRLPLLIRYPLLQVPVVRRAVVESSLNALEPENVPAGLRVNTKHRIKTLL